jgi:RNA polymerase sigma-70 factor (ECF subfamily)
MPAAERFEGLLEGARSGDQAAFTRVFRLVQPRLHRFVSTMLAERADDICSETWIRVVAGLRRFEGDESQFVAWVFAIARNKVIDELRYSGRRPTAPLATDVVGRADLGPGLDPVAVVEESEGTRRAIALVRTLPPDQAEVVFLRAVVGLTNAEVSEIVGKSAGAVRVLAHRGLRRLARTVALETREEV